jgi:Flp pilus assembly protein TadG
VTRARRADLCQADDRGSIAPLVPIVMFALLLLGGLVVDGSRLLNARGDAQAFAEEAARSGSTAIVRTAPFLEVDPPTAGTLVDAYCTAIEKSVRTDVTVQSCGVDDSVANSDLGVTKALNCQGTMEDLVVHVKVVVQIDTTLLGLAHFSHLSATAYAAARPYEGLGAQGNPGIC